MYLILAGCLILVGLIISSFFGKARDIQKIDAQNNREDPKLEVKDIPPGCTGLTYSLHKNHSNLPFVYDFSNAECVGGEPVIINVTEDKKINLIISKATYKTLLSSAPENSSSVLYVNNITVLPRLKHLVATISAIKRLKHTKEIVRRERIIKDVVV